MNEEAIKQLADELWDQVIHFNATQESVTAAIRRAYQEGMDAARSEDK